MLFLIWGSYLLLFWLYPFNYPFSEEFRIFNYVVCFIYVASTIVCLMIERNDKNE